MNPITIQLPFVVPLVAVDSEAELRAKEARRQENIEVSRAAHQPPGRRSLQPHLTSL